MTNPRLVLLTAVLAAVLACGPAGRGNGSGDAPAEGRHALDALAANGLAENGLAERGLAAAAFSSWFIRAPELSDAMMDDVVRCAVPAGSDRTWNDPATGARHVWHGEMGLAPKWSAGAAATLLEKHLVTVCLASLKRRPVPPQARVARSAI